MIFDFKTGTMNTDWPGILELWRAADESGCFRGGWTVDHIEPSPQDRRGPCLEAWSMLAALATATHDLRLGCQVSAIAFRHPAILAKAATTIDHVSNGRLTVGLGAGWNYVETAANGIPFHEDISRRFDVFEEAVAVLDLLLRSGTREPISFQGEWFVLSEAFCEPKPLQTRIPFAIGGNGEKRTLPIVARFADHWNSTLGDVDQWRRKRDIVWRNAESNGRSPLEIETSINVTIDIENFGDALRQIETFRTAGADVAVLNLVPPHSRGVIAKLEDELTKIV